MFPELFKLPKCSFCGREWIPGSGRMAGHHYCAKCSSERKRAAMRAVGVKMPEQECAKDYLYSLPRRVCR